MKVILNIIGNAKAEILKRPFGITISVAIFGLFGMYFLLPTLFIPLGMLNLIPVKFNPDTIKIKIFLELQHSYFLLFYGSYFLILLMKFGIQRKAENTTASHLRYSFSYLVFPLQLE